MRCCSIFAFGGMVGWLLVAHTAFAGKAKAVDYSQRVHVLISRGFRQYHPGIHILEDVNGFGKGNLFENGEVHGFSFSYDCAQPIPPQSAFETFPARWKKQGRELEIIYPRMGGKPGDMYTCDLNVNMTQGTAYIRRAGALVEEPSAEYEQWMTAHQYDPEHGKDQPVGIGPKRLAGDATPEN